jgi:hypothetical protein
MADWLKRAKEAYQTSTTYVDANFRRMWEDNLRHFQSRHAAGSKYYKDFYKYRTKGFRPKTRAAIRNIEAAAVAAFFANEDVVSIEPQNENDQAQVASAELMKEILQYRLTKTIPWFLIAIGAVQDATVQGVVASYQHWKYEEGEYDEPEIELLPVENVRISPNAKWTDPVGSSPYLIILWPTYVMDVRERMSQTDDKTGMPKWNTLSDDQIRAAMKQTFDSTRQVREQSREDKYQNTSSADLMDFDVVWVHENHMRIAGKDLVYWTLGTEQLLTEPKPLKDVYLHGERPVVIGTCMVETHKLYPDSIVRISQPLQQEMNELSNQRQDNVKLVLNKRYIVRQGSQTDLQSLLRNVPGSVTMANDVTADVREMEFTDVTASSYQEQDRLNVDYDELVGTFSTSTIQTNRKLNETVGGMNMLRGGANALTEYLLRCLSETWMEKVMRQLVKLEQAYETDEVVLTTAGNQAQLFQKYGINQITDELLNAELTTKVNVGMGATDPLSKVHNLLAGVAALAQAAQAAQMLNLNMPEIEKEVFARMGYKDGSRFINQQEPGQQQDPEKMQMGQMIQQMQQVIQQLQQEAQQLQTQVKSKQDQTDAQLTIAALKTDAENRKTAAQLHAQIHGKIMDLDSAHILAANAQEAQVANQGGANGS